MPDKHLPFFLMFTGVPLDHHALVPKLRPLVALILGIVLLQPAQRGHEDHCASHPVGAGLDAPGHQHEAPAPAPDDCDHETMDACASMTSCLTLSAEPPSNLVVAMPPLAAPSAGSVLSPTFRTSSPDTPPPRA